MTRREAAEKVAKLLQLARGSTNPHEASTAQRQADKIAREHGLTKQDLESGKMAAAFDEIVDQVGKIASSSPLPQGLFDSRSIIGQVLQSIKGIGENDKSSRLRQLTNLVRVASFVAGDNKHVAEVKVALDTALKNHDIII
jgi:hypothetical protein